MSDPKNDAAHAEARQDALATIFSVLDLENIEDNVFRGLSPKDRWQRVFGGQVLGQALVAASRTVEGRICHSLHAYFLRPGDPRTPILYEVDLSRDGLSFAARRVVAIQHGKQIFTMAASFQVPEDGLEHHAAMPDVPAPEELKSEQQWRSEIASEIPEHVRAWFLRPRPIEFRAVEPANRFAKGPHKAQQTVWFRAVGPLPDFPSLHQCVLAYASDMTLLDTSLLPHGRTLFAPEMQLASLDHAIWFHRPARADEWLLYVQDSPSASAFATSGVEERPMAFFTAATCDAQPRRAKERAANAVRCRAGFIRSPCGHTARSPAELFGGFGSSRA
ncbi:MAG: acyl-CoA thioesterase II [Alphaproteobacteria bacterium]|nr:acyl-CoA thioesterase II [Alphaproteobacteria bacterium]